MANVNCWIGTFLQVHLFVAEAHCCCNLPGQDGQVSVVTKTSKGWLDACVNMGQGPHLSAGSMIGPMYVFITERPAVTTFQFDWPTLKHMNALT